MKHLKVSARLRRASAGLVVLAVLAAACGTSRPDVPEWRERWDFIRSGIPAESDVGESPPNQLCTDTLAFIREQQPGLFPTADPTIDDVVRDWVEVAEDAFFECPPRGAPVDSFAEAYRELDRLAAEVDTVLELDT